MPSATIICSRSHARGSPPSARTCVSRSPGSTSRLANSGFANASVLALPRKRRGSLLDCIDRTVTAAGSRLLAQRLAAPLTDPAAIAQRLDAVSAFAGDTAARADTRSRLQAAPDLARALSRLVLGRGGPRDLA